MPEYLATVEAALRGASLRIAWLVTLDFTSGAVRLHDGDGDLLAHGLTYAGGHLNSVSEIDAASGYVAATGTVIISGVDQSFVDAVLSASDEVRGRDLTIALQYFDEDGATLDTSDVLVSALMDRAKLKGSADQRTVEITYETLWSRRAFPPNGNLSDRDQQRRYPGDKGMAWIAHVPRMALKLYPLPN